MVYTQVEITPKSPENDMKKQGSELLPQKPRTRYTLDDTQVYTPETPMDLQGKF